MGECSCTTVDIDEQVAQDEADQAIAEKRLARFDALIARLEGGEEPHRVLLDFMRDEREILQYFADSDVVESAAFKRHCEEEHGYVRRKDA